jgi:hypothetical protein
MSVLCPYACNCHPDEAIAKNSFTHVELYPAQIGDLIP